MKNTNKKAQIAVFILLGFIMLIAIGFISYINSETIKKGKDTQKIPFELMPIKNYVDSCIKQVAEDALILIGSQGGYYELPELSIKDEFFKTAYYHHEGNDISPNKEKIEEEISKYINKNLSYCINDFIDFKEIGFKIEQGEINTKTTITQNDVLFNVNFPITTKKEETIQKIEQFRISMPNIRLNTVYNVSKEIINLQMQHKSSICISCLVDMGSVNDLYIDIFEYGNDSIIFTIRDYNPDFKLYNFTFAIKHESFSCDNLPDDADIITMEECMSQRIEDLGA